MDLFSEPSPDFGGIRRLELRLPFQPGSVNVYLVPQESGWILVDTGMNLPTSLSTYEDAGIQWSAIRQTVLTHVHPDHSGLAARIREVTGAPIRMHRREEDVLKRLREPESWLAWQDEILREAGVPESARIGIQDVTLHLRGLFPAMEADSYIEDGEVIPTALGPMQALLTPGHSPGHLCFYFPQKRILLTGDQMLKPRAPHLEWNPEGSALAEFRASLEELSHLDVDWVLPSHGRPFRGHRARARVILNHSRAMQAQIRNLRASGIDSTHDLAEAFWNRTLQPYEHRGAVFEILAYLQQPD
jgi:glyoxylase-like metal-dependent hydrolase (beta-lactamase superfamily II)